MCEIYLALKLAIVEWIGSNYIEISFIEVWKEYIYVYKNVIHSKKYNIYLYV